MIQDYLVNLAKDGTVVTKADCSLHPLPSRLGELVSRPHARALIGAVPEEERDDLLSGLEAAQPVPIELFLVRVEVTGDGCSQWR
jgi:hypothetical protein